MSEFEFKIVSEALRRFDYEYRVNTQKKEASDLVGEADRSFFTYYLLVKKYIARAKEANLEKKEECLAYLNYTLETDTPARLHYKDLHRATNRVQSLYIKMRPAKGKVSKVRRWLEVSNPKNRMLVRKHWDEVVSILVEGLKTVERYEMEHSVFEEEMHTLKQVAEDRKTELADEMDRHYGLSKL